MAAPSAEPPSPLRNHAGAALRVLVAEPDAARRLSLCAGLTALGAEVLARADTKAAEVDVDVLLIHARCAEGDGEALPRRPAPDGARTVCLVYAADSAQAVRAAWRAGAIDALPGLPPLEELLASVLPALEARRAAARERRLELSLDSSQRDEARARAELCALGAWAGLGPAARGRLLCSLAEVYENVRRHAYGAGGSGPVECRALARPGLVEVQLCDRGRGFDGEHAREAGVLAAAGLERFPAGQAYAAGGLARARSLCERFDWDSGPGRGTRVDFAVVGYPASFAEESDDFADPLEESLAPLETDFSDRDHLEASELRRLLLALTREDPRPAQSLPPALAVSLGRVLNAAGRGARPLLRRSA